MSLHFLVAGEIVPADHEKLRELCDTERRGGRGFPPERFPLTGKFVPFSLPRFSSPFRAESFRFVTTPLARSALLDLDSLTKRIRCISRARAAHYRTHGERIRGISKERPLKYETKPSARLGLVHTIIAGYSALAERYIENRMVVPLALARAPPVPSLENKTTA